MTKKKLQILLSAAAFFFLTSEVTPSAAKERKVSRIEKRADRNFIRQKFDKAMSQYDLAIRREKDEDSQAALHLKIARLNFMVGDYPHASESYARAMELRGNTLLVDDVCNYIDALRFQGEARKAEAICLNNAYKDIYSRYQRYQNTLQALAMQYSIEEDPGYYVKRLSLNSANPEFWVGVFDEQPFYAMSYSRFNDPNKLFFHRTHYYELNETGEPDSEQQITPRYYNYFRSIPADMHNGPVSFSPDMKMMISTVVKYDNMNTAVDMVDKRLRPFQTQLYYSVLRNKKHRFTKYRPVFPEGAPGVSYAHPYLFDDGKAMLFASDMPGGYGGFDLYLSRYDDETQTWGTPENLGPEVNTEGDEIFPVLYKDHLIFSSNGLPGFGGYDLFSAFYDKDGVIVGSVSHFPAPVNSVFNDYYMCPLSLRTAYFISDRNQGGKDDIYYLRTTDELGTQRGMPYYGMSEEAAIMGGQLLLNGMAETTIHESIIINNRMPKGLLLTLYFDFDSSDPTVESVRRLQEYINRVGGYKFNELSIEGFADEIGSERYNFGLSGRRAEAVARLLRDGGVKVNYNVQGKGSLRLSPEEVKEELRSAPWSDTGIDWVQANRLARRVEIYNK